MIGCAVRKRIDDKIRLVVDDEMRIEAGVDHRTLGTVLDLAVIVNRTVRTLMP